ncbi:barstar family protein [Streptomyces sp. NPDC001668]|uniref:barstar family protein n=1 Tax=unclassified Streptomyces TaxID=2593676 RepID=UPI00369BD710
MEFSEGLTILSPAEVSAVLAEAGRQHLPMFVLATDGRVDRETFFHAVRETLPLDPPLAGTRSWDALSDSLWEGLRTLESPHVVIVWPDAVSPADGADEDFRIAQEVLRDITESLTDPVTTSGTPKRVSVFIAVDPGP